MRVLILSQYYSPEPIPKPVELAVGLQQTGDSVSVITGFPDYPSGILYEGYRLCWKTTEEIDGIPIVRTFEYPYHGTRAAGRFANYLSFMLSAPWGALTGPRPDVMYVWHPPLTVGIAAWIIARMRRIPFVYDVQDIWPEAAVLSGILKPGLVVKCLSVLERFIYRRADHIIAVTEGARQNIISKGVSPEKVSAMPHWFDETIFSPTATAQRPQVREKYGWQGKCVMLFAGNLGLVQGLDTLVNAAERLRDRSDIHLAFVGDGADKARLEGMVRSLGLSASVQFIGRKPMSEMPAILAAADALIVHLKHSELSNFVIPTKTLAYLGSGTPLIMAMHGAAADLVQASGAGIVVPPENPEAIAEAAIQIAGMTREDRLRMGALGAVYLKKHLSRDVVLPKYRQLLAQVAGAN